MNSQARFPMPYGYGFIPFVYLKRVGESAGLPRSALITAKVGLGSSCLPAEQHLRMSCVKRS
jgi:hypothetical protein